MFSTIEEAREKYLAGYELSLPYKTSFGWVLEEVRGFCPNCNKELSKVRGHINEYSSCVEIRTIGLCHPCKAIIECNPIRHYEDGHTLVRDEEQGWIETNDSEDHSGTFKMLIYTVILGILTGVSLGILILMIKS